MNGLLIDSQMLLKDLPAYIINIEQFMLEDHDFNGDNKTDEDDYVIYLETQTHGH